MQVTESNKKWFLNLKVGCPLLSLKADGQLKNKNTVSIGCSGGNTATTSVHAIAFFFLNPTPEQPTKTNRRRQGLTHSDDLLIAEDPDGAGESCP